MCSFFISNIVFFHFLLCGLAEFQWNKLMILFAHSYKKSPSGFRCGCDIVISFVGINKAMSICYEMTPMAFA